MKLFNFYGTEIRVHWSTVIPFAIVCQDPFHFVFMFIIFATVLVHELGHVVMAWEFDIRCPKVVLCALGGIALMESEPETPKQEFFVAWAGPAVNMGIIVVCLLLVGSVSNALLVPVILVSAFMISFNMIPAYPMDGGRMLHAFLWWAFGKHTAFLVCEYLTVFLASLGASVGLVFNMPMLLIVSIAVGIMGAANEQEDISNQVDEGSGTGRAASEQDNELLRIDAPSEQNNGNVRRPFSKGVTTPRDGGDGKEVEGNTGR